MERVITVPEAGPGGGLRFEWEDGFEIGLTATPAGVVIKANRAGLVSLARHLPTLAQENATPVSHLHLTADQEIDGDLGLILERGVEDE